MNGGLNGIERNRLICAPGLSYMFNRAVTWLKHCRYGVKLYPINIYSIKHSFCLFKTKLGLFSLLIASLQSINPLEKKKPSEQDQSIQ